MEPSEQVDAWPIGPTKHWSYDPIARHFFDLTNQSSLVLQSIGLTHDDVIKWKHFSHYWPFLRSLANSPRKGQLHGALIFPLICTWTNFWINDHDTGDLRRHRAHYDVTVMDYTNDPEVLWIAAKMVISSKNNINANFAYNYDLWNNEMLVFTVHYRARVHVYYTRLNGRA